MPQAKNSKNHPAAAPVEIRRIGLSSDAEAILSRIEKRAYELFESNGRTTNRDLDNWITAETELFQLAPFQSTESGEHLTVEVDVHEFMPKELEIDLEPQRLTVIGKPGNKAAHSDGGRHDGENHSFLLRCLLLPETIDPRLAKASMQGGRLLIELPKSAPV